jgi:hypothetical protein
MYKEGHQDKMQQWLQSTPKLNASNIIKAQDKHLQTEGEMLWGLPHSKKLGRWSGHS